MRLHNSALHLAFTLQLLAKLSPARYLLSELFADALWAVVCILHDDRCSCEHRLHRTIRHPSMTMRRCTPPRLSYILLERMLLQSCGHQINTGFTHLRRTFSFQLPDLLLEPHTCSAR